MHVPGPEAHSKGKRWELWHRLDTHPDSTVPTSRATSWPAAQEATSFQEATPTYPKPAQRWLLLLPLTMQFSQPIVPFLAILHRPKSSQSLQKSTPDPVDILQEALPQVHAGAPSQRWGHLASITEGRLVG